MIQEANLQWRYEDTETYLVMPWYTLPTLKWLKERNTKTWRVFEYGAGYSTVWWRANSLLLKSVESAESWAKAMGADYVTNREEYIKSCFASPMPNGGYDCVIVDGEDRPECVEHCHQFVKSGGIIIVDNYNEPGGFDCTKIDEILKDWTIVVHQQPNHTNWRTAVFQKP